MPLTGKKITFIGAGSMAEPIFKSLIQQKTVRADQIYIMNRSNAAHLTVMRDTYRVHAAFTPEEKESFIREADIVILAMKPKDVRQAFEEFNRFLNPSQLLVSMVAGLSLETLSLLVPEGMSIVRTMPNTPSSIGLGATGLCFSPETTESQQNMGLSLFRAIGEAYPIPEEKMNILTGISGSGPAYAFYFMESMIAAGVKGGLSPELAKELTVQTVLGAASMVKLSGEEPAELRRKVTSPNGTTQMAIEEFQRQGLSGIVEAGINRCVARAAEIGEGLSQEVRQSL